MIAGAIGLLMTTLVFGPRRSAGRETVVEDYGPRRRVVQDDVL
jgi:hypothetical protein